MPQAEGTSSVRRATNYSNCPLKKRPIKYDFEEESDSDISRNGSSPITVTVEVSEPEDLSTKIEDRLFRNPNSIISDPDESSTSPPSPYQSSPTYSHHYYNPSEFYPHHVPRFSPSEASTPWPRISPFSSAFNFSIGPANPAEKYIPSSIQNYSRYQNEQPLNFVKESRQFSPQSHFAPLRQNVITSTVSPPIKSEPYYLPIKVQGVVSPLENNTRLLNNNISDIHRPIIKQEMHYHHSSDSSLSRDSIISHTQGHSCSSGISSPSSSCSSNGLPPTPTNGGSVRHQCPDCNKSYSTYSGLTKHIQFHCSSQNKKSFICKFCEKVYVSLGALKMHIRTHTLPCKCLKCGKAFSRPWLLQGHIRTHTGEKPFTCQHCNRAFADRSNLRAHLQTHSEVKKYSCKACGKTFSRMSLLVKHEVGGCSASPCN